MKRLFVSLVLLSSICAASAQHKKDSVPAPKEESANLIDFKKDQQSETKGSVTIEGKIINYTAVSGLSVLKNSNDIPTLAMSYTYYSKSDEKDPAKRPITFIYNGGPGSATFWLHMGAFGPQKVYTNDTGRTRAPFYTVNNDYSLLDASDLVFIDAPGTGFGRLITKDMGGAGERENFYGIDQDGAAFTDFIQKFITDNNRWNSPKFLFGESYGTFRSAVVAKDLYQKSISLNGVILLSQLFNYGFMTETAEQNPGNGLPFQLVLPSFAATAWYHHKLPNQPKELEPFLREVEAFALNEYAVALNKGATLSESEYNAIAEKLHSYTGLPVDYIKKANLRINGPKFEQTLLGDSSNITGRLDSRFSGKAIDPLSENAEYDPMDAYIDAPFTATWNNYVRNTLKFGKGLTYKNFGNVYPWNFKRGGFVGFPNVMNDLAETMVLDPDLKVMLNQGYYDLGTPYFEGIYEMQQLPMHKDLQKNIEYAQYKSGHMVYLHKESLKQLHDNVANFISKNYKK